MPAASPAVARAPSPSGLRGRGGANAHLRCDHENASPIRRDTKRLRACLELIDGTSVPPCKATRQRPPLNYRALLRKLSVREKTRSPFVLRRKAQQAFVSAPRAAFVPVGAAYPKGADHGAAADEAAGFRRDDASQDAFGGTPMSRRRFRGCAPASRVRLRHSRFWIVASITQSVL